MKQRIRLLLSLVCALSFAGTTSASTGLGVIPKQIDGEQSRSWFVHTLSPGETKEDILQVNNSSDVTQTIVVEALDGVNTAEGAYSLVKSSSQNRYLGTWVQLETNSVTVRPRSTAEVKFKIAVPFNAPVGEHSGGLVAFLKPVDTGEDVQLKVRVGARIYITVPGKVERKVSVSKFAANIDGRKLTFDYKAVNESNVNLSPTFDITLKGIFGSSKQTIQPTSIYLPGAPINLTYNWPKRLGFFGYYTAEISLRTNPVKEYNADKTSTELPSISFNERTTFWMGLTNLKWIILTLLLAWVAYCGYRYHLALRRFKTFTTKYTVKEKETLPEIANSIEVLPTDIARYNGLVWPYPLNPGEELLIPLRPLTPKELEEKAQNSKQPNFWKYLFLVK